MYAVAQPEAPAKRTVDERVHLVGARWEDYERLLEIRGECSKPRITYLEGTIELMSPSYDHDLIKSVVGRLVEVFCLEHHIRFTAIGSWTIKKKEAERGAEADECYIFGPNPRAKSESAPDLAIEVVWTSGGLDKLDVYRKLGVQEVWFWKDGKISVHELRGEAYTKIARSAFLPDLDLDELVTFLDRPTAYDAIQDYRAALLAKK